MTCRGPVLILFLAGLVSACSSGSPVADIAPGARPDIETDEAGLWMQMDKLESRLRTSGRIVTDPALNAYLRDVTCRIDPEYCRDLRIYIVRTPHFNASMAPNGTMQVWTGLLLRVENEAQLAYVLGHEMGHYIRRHSVQRWRELRGRTDAGVFLQVATALAGVGFVGDLAQLANLAGIMAYSRDQERESDDIGFDLMTRAGYDASQAPRIWANLLAEREAAGEDRPSVFFSSHPAGEERIATLEQAAADFSGGTVGQEAFLAATRPLRAGWLSDEIAKRDFAGMTVVLDNLLAVGENPGELHFFKGELQRLRAEDGDLENAVEAYRAALETAGAPPETHRSLGLVYWKLGRNLEAQTAFEEYLSRSPDAPDKAMIEFYQAQLQ